MVKTSDWRSGRPKMSWVRLPQQDKFWGVNLSPSSLLVSSVSVYCDWVWNLDRNLPYFTVWQHVKMSRVRKKIQKHSDVELGYLPSLPLGKALIQHMSLLALALFIRRLVWRTHNIISSSLDVKVSFTFTFYSNVFCLIFVCNIEYSRLKVMKRIYLTNSMFLLFVVLL